MHAKVNENCIHRRVVHISRNWRANAILGERCELSGKRSKIFGEAIYLWAMRVLAEGSELLARLGERGPSSCQLLLRSGETWQELASAASVLASSCSEVASVGRTSQCGPSSGQIVVRSGYIAYHGSLFYTFHFSFLRISCC